MDVIVPGSVANLGSGFDTLAVAVQLYLRVRILDVRDDGGGVLKVISSNPPVRGENAVERAFAAMVVRSGRRTPSVRVDVESDIPMAAGLGSSAAATVAGLRVFERVTDSLADNMLLAAATAAEGHADNAAAAIHGGLTSVVEGTRDGLPEALRWRWPEELRLVVATPHTGLATSKARAVLAESLPREDAVFNLQRVLAFVHALEHEEFDRIREAVQDRWHQPSRTSLVPHLGAALELEDRDVLGAFLAGAGPSVAVIARRDFGRVERLLQSTCERAGCPATVRTLGVHQSSKVLPGVLASAHGRTV